MDLYNSICRITNKIKKSIEKDKTCQSIKKGIYYYGPILGAVSLGALLFPGALCFATANPNIRSAYNKWLMGLGAIYGYNIYFNGWNKEDNKAWKDLFNYKYKAPPPNRPIEYSYKPPQQLPLIKFWNKRDGRYY